MKRFFALLSVLLLLCSSAHADSPLFAAASEQLIYAAVQPVLEAEEIEFEAIEEYHSYFFSFDLENSQVLGHADLTLYAFSDGLLVGASYYDPVPAEHTDEVIRLCNHFNAGVYIGKFYLDPDNYLCYELFRPLDALTIDAKDKEGIVDDIYLSASVLDYYGEYFGEIIHHGEKADHVYAMWLADEE